MGRILLREARDLQNPSAAPDWKEKLIQIGAVMGICVLMVIAAWMAPLGMH